jgi:hypothetical protein
LKETFLKEEGPAQAGASEAADEETC